MAHREKFYFQKNILCFDLNYIKRTKTPIKNYRFERAIYTAQMVSQKYLLNSITDFPKLKLKKLTRSLSYQNSLFSLMSSLFKGTIKNKSL